MNMPLDALATLLREVGSKGESEGEKNGERSNKNRQSIPGFPTSDG